MASISTGQIAQALKRANMRCEILRCIDDMRSPNVSQLAKALETERHHVLFHLYILKAEGYVKDRWISNLGPFNRSILCHEWQLKRKAKRLLREGGLLLEVCRRGGSLSAWNPKVESSGDETAGIIPPRAESNSDINLLRAKQAASLLHAFSLVRKTSTSR